jgi:hypothetical protein
MKSSVFWVAIRCVVRREPDAAEEYIASIFRDEEYAKQETSRSD